jgi:hypothetical protein
MKKILDEATIGAMVLIAMCVVLFAMIKALVSNGDRTLGKVVVMFFVAVPVGLIAGLVSFEWGLGQFTACLIASMATLLSEQIVLSIVNNKINFSELFKRLAENLIDKWTR